MKTTKRYSVVRDTREKSEQGWFFFESDFCAGMQTEKLDVGDYTLKGFEDIFTVERKGSVTEYASNISKEIKRFKRELVRGAHLKHIWLVLEFHIDSLINYPKIPEVPRHVANQIRFKGYAALSKTLELQITYPNLHIMFVGPEKGINVAGSIFKRMVEKYSDEAKSSDDNADN